MTKLCKKCNIIKDLTDFYTSKRSKDGHQHYCIECNSKEHAKYRAKYPNKMSENSRSYRVRFPEKHKRSDRNTHLKRLYGLTIEDYDRILENQGGVCAICKATEHVIDKRTGEARRLSVDHSEITREVRGLLCKACNTSIGAMKEDIEIFNSAIEYLKKHK